MLSEHIAVLLIPLVLIFAIMLYLGFGWIAIAISYGLFLCSPFIIFGFVTLMMYIFDHKNFKKNMCK